MQATFCPPFYVRYRKMRVAQNVPLLRAGGQWWPPKAYGRNIIPRGHPVDLAFYCSGQDIAASQLPQNVAPCQTISMYAYREAFYMINYDATILPVGDGRDADDESGEVESSDAEGPYMDWTELSFTPQNDCTSFASFAGTQWRLSTQHETHLFANRLLPARYHAAQNAWISNPNDAAILGGMNGELSIVLALMAMSRPPEFVWHAFVQGFRNGRFVVPGQGSHGRNDERGLVIDVFYDPANPDVSNLEYLKAFSEGRWATLFR